MFRFVFDVDTGTSGQWPVDSGQRTVDGTDGYTNMAKYICCAQHIGVHIARIAFPALAAFILLPTCRVEFPSVFDLLASNKAIKINLTVIKLAIGSW